MKHIIKKALVLPAALIVASSLVVGGCTPATADATDMATCERIADDLSDNLARAEAESIALRHTIEKRDRRIKRLKAKVRTLRQNASGGGYWVQVNGGHGR